MAGQTALTPDRHRQRHRVDQTPHHHPPRGSRLCPPVARRTEHLRLIGAAKPRTERSGASCPSYSPHGYRRERIPTWAPPATATDPPMVATAVAASVLCASARITPHEGHEALASISGHRATILPSSPGTTARRVGDSSSSGQTKYPKSSPGGSSSSPGSGIPSPHVTNFTFSSPFGREKITTKSSSSKVDLIEFPSSFRETH